MESAPPPPLLRATPAARPYPLLELLGQTSLLRHELAPGEVGTPLRLQIRLLDPLAEGAPIRRAAVYCWHGANGGVQLTGPDGAVCFDTAYPRREDDGIARLHLQVFLLNAGQVCGAALAHVALPEHATSQVHPTVPTPPAAPRPAEGTPVVLARLPGSPDTGYQATLCLAVTLEEDHRALRRRVSDPSPT